MERIRAILFDLDNTLVDFLGMKEQACRAAAQAMVTSGLRMSEDEVYSRLMQTYFSVGIESDHAFTEFLKRARLQKTKVARRKNRNYPGFNQKCGGFIQKHVEGAGDGV